MQTGAPLHIMDNYVYPDDFYGGIGGYTFEWVFLNKPEWVTYSRVWTKGTGFFEIWLNYVKRKHHV